MALLNAKLNSRLLLYHNRTLPHRCLTLPRQSLVQQWKHHILSYPQRLTVRTPLHVFYLFLRRKWLMLSVLSHLTSQLKPYLQLVQRLLSDQLQTHLQLVRSQLRQPSPCHHSQLRPKHGFPWPSLHHSRLLPKCQHLL